MMSEWDGAYSGGVGGVYRIYLNPEADKKGPVDPIALTNITIIITSQR